MCSFLRVKLYLAKSSSLTIKGIYKGNSKVVF